MDRIYNKLVRDKIPDIVKEKGEIPITRYLDDIEYKTQLELKLCEEYKEVIAASGDDRLEELADMLEVIRALARLENKSLDDVIRIAGEKNQKRGAFEERIFLEKVIGSKN